MDAKIVKHASVLWDYHQLNHEVGNADVGLGLGSHDLGVAKAAVQLYRERCFPILVFSGGNSPTTRDRFPRGEAVHYAEYAASEGVPEDRILIESAATNTSENFSLTKHLLEANGISVGSILVICKPYMQRRAYLSCGKVWPEVKVTCTSEETITLDEYIKQIGDPKLVVDMLVGDTQRIDVYGKKGFALEERLPDEVQDSFEYLVNSGYTSRLI